MIGNSRELRVRVIERYDDGVLEDDVNDFLKSEDVEVVDIKLSHSLSDADTISSSVMVVYKTK